MVKVNGQVVSTLKNSLAIDDAIEERSTCSFSLIDADDITKGHPVEVTDGTTLLFAGVIDDVKEDWLNNTTRIQRITCVDQHYRADKRIIAAAYENQYSGDIIKSIIGAKLAEEGILSEVPIQSQTWLLYRNMTWGEINSQGGKS